VTVIMRDPLSLARQPATTLRRFAPVIKSAGRDLDPPVSRPLTGSNSTGVAKARPGPTVLRQPVPCDGGFGIE
jgi:hypothetical protein